MAEVTLTFRVTRNLDGFYTMYGGVNRNEKFASELSLVEVGKAFGDEIKFQFDLQESETP